MAAFDSMQGMVSVFFDSDDLNEIEVSLTDEDERQVPDTIVPVITITPAEAIEVVKDFLAAVLVRGQYDMVRELLREVPTWGPWYDKPNPTIAEMAAL